jgi:ferredoxin
MKTLKSKLVLFFLGVLLFGCKKNEIAEVQKKLTIQDVAKELNFKVSGLAQVEERIIKKYKTVENWRKQIIALRAKKKEHPHQTNTRNTSGTATLTVNENGVYYTFNNMDTDMTIKDFLETTGFNMPPCDGVGCSPTCIAKLHSGWVDQSSQSFLNDCEIEGGYLLPCVAYCFGSVSIIFADDMYPTPYTGVWGDCSEALEGDAIKEESWHAFYGDVYGITSTVWSTERLKGKRKWSEPQGGHFTKITHLGTYCPQANQGVVWDVMHSDQSFYNQTAMSRIIVRITRGGNDIIHSDRTKTFYFSQVFP